MNIYKKIKIKIKNNFNKFERQFYIKYLKFIKKSDYNRWSKKESLFNSWNERTLLLSKEIKSKSIVFEFGAANLYLKELLPTNCTYLHSDLVKRNDATIIIDLNKELPELPYSNYIVFSGVLEYVFNVENLLLHCSKYTDSFLLSYATFDKFTKIKNRRLNGWVSDKSDIDIKNIANLINFKIKIIGDWKGQTLYHLTKITK